MQALQIFNQVFKQIPKLGSSLIQGLNQNLGKFKALSILLLMALCLGACNSSEPKNFNSSTNLTSASTNISAGKVTISEVSPPPAIQKLSRSFDAFEPQIKILEPKSDQILTDTKVAVRFEVKDLPIFKNPDLGLGTHIHVILDNQEYKASYDLSQPLVFENLAVGTHTIRAFASRPWHESFKKEPLPSLRFMFILKRVKIPQILNYQCLPIVVLWACMGLSQLCWIFIYKIPRFTLHF
jgi:hypothetical protein